MREQREKENKGKVEPGNPGKKILPGRSHQHGWKEENIMSAMNI